MGRQVGVIFGTFGAQVALLNGICSKNVIFEKTSAVWATARFWRSTRPKMGSRRLQECLEEQFFGLLKIVLNFDSFWVRFWSILASQIPPHKLGRSPPFFHVESDLILTCLQEDLRARPRGPKMPPRAPKPCPRGPQTPPRAPKEAPRSPKRAPRGPQDPPKSAQRGSKDPQETS